jgi:hypothetical protein
MITKPFVHVFYDFWQDFLRNLALADEMANIDKSMAFIIEHLDVYNHLPL